MGGRDASQHFPVVYKLDFALNLLHGQHFSHAATNIFQRVSSDVNSFSLLWSKNAAVC